MKHAPINIHVALPSLEAIKRAVEMKMGVALLPKRCALTELSRGQLAAVKVQQVRLARQLRLVYRRAGEMSHAAQAFLPVARVQHPETCVAPRPYLALFGGARSDRTDSLDRPGTRSTRSDPSRPDPT